MSLTADCMRHDDVYTSLKIASGTPAKGQITMWSEEGFIRAGATDLDIVRYAVRSRKDRTTVDLRGRVTLPVAIVLYSLRAAYASGLEAEGTRDSVYP